MSIKSDVREAKKRANPSKQGYQSIRGGYPTHQSDVREAKKRADPSIKDINPSEGVNQPTKAKAEEAQKIFKHRGGALLSSH